MNISEEIIDSFVRGDLSGADLETFNNALSADPKLRQEVSFQKDIVESLKNYRHQQLKSRLNAIDVKPVGGIFTSPYVKLAASIGIVALLTGSFVLFNKTTTVSNNNGTENVTNDSENTINTISEESQTTVAADNSQTESEELKNSSSIQHSNTLISKESPKQAEEVPSYSEPSDKDMDEDFGIEHVNEDVNMPAMNDGSASISSPQVKVSIVKENKNLGYRFFNNQLFLHGNFSNSTYELFELNNKPSKQLFLYFENNYYELIQGKTKITALTPITDKAILLQLTQLREH